MAPTDYNQTARPRQGAILSGEAEVAAPMLQRTLSQSAQISAQLDAKYPSPTAETTAPAAETTPSATTGGGGGAKPAAPTHAHGPGTPKPGKME